MLPSYYNNVFYGDSARMSKIPDSTVDLIVTSPPYFNIKDYSLDGYQVSKHSSKHPKDIGDTKTFSSYIKKLLSVWKECFRVLRPNGKLCINVPLMPLKKNEYHTHYNRDIFDIQSSIQNSILHDTEFYLMDLYIWHRTNGSKKLMFGSYPYPGNYYAQNTCEFIAVYVKDGKPKKVSLDIKESSKLSQTEWVEFTKQIWSIPIPNKGDLAFGVHSAIMPEEIARRCIKLFSFKNDLVLDPFAGSGTTLKVAIEEERNFVGYELYDSYKEIIDKKIDCAKGGSNDS